jgi:hypothetical protein
MQPDFSPGAGWHRIEGMRIPECTADLEERARRAYRCCVLRMRERGARVPPDALLGSPTVNGALLMMQPAGTYWVAHLFDAETVRRELLRIVDAHLVRDHDGCRLYQGFELEGGAATFAADLAVHAHGRASHGDRADHGRAAVLTLAGAAG